MLDWQTILSVVALGLAGITLLSKMLDKGLSIREHEEFRRGNEVTIVGLKGDIQRQIDRIDRRIDVIEQSRPSVGELQTVSKSLSERIHKIELMDTKKT